MSHEAGGDADAHAGGPRLSPRFRTVPQFDHGKRVFRAGEIEAIGLSPACFRAGGKRHVPAPYSITDSAQQIIAAQASSFGLVSDKILSPRQKREQMLEERRLLSARGGNAAAIPRPPTAPGGNSNNSSTTTPVRGSVATPQDMAEASARKQERRLIESLLACPTSGALAAGARPASGASSSLVSVPRAFQKDHVDWRPSGPHDHIPPLPEARAKTPPKPLPLDEEGKHVVLNLRLLKDPRANNKPLSDKVPTKHDGVKVDYNKLVTRLTDDVRFRKTNLETTRKKYENDEKAKAQLDLVFIHSGGTKHADADSKPKPVTEDGAIEWVQRFQGQPLHTRAVKREQLVKKYAPPLFPKKKLEPGEQRASTARLYEAGREKQREAMEKAFKEHVESKAPRTVKLPEEQLLEMASRLATREAPNG